MSDRKSEAFWSYENRLLSVLTLTFGFVFFDRAAMSFLAPFVARELALNNVQIGLLASALSATWAVSGYTVGRICDRRGNYRVILVGAMVVFSLCSFVSGLATSFIMLLLTRALMGAAEGPVLPIAQTLMAQASSESRRGFNMGTMQTFGSYALGAFLAPIVLISIASHWGWREAFFVAGVPGLICAVAAWGTVRDPSRRPATAGSMARTSSSLREMLRHRNIRLCMALAGLLVGTVMLGFVFLPVYFAHALRMSPTEISIMMSMMGLSSVISGLLVPGISDRVGRKPVMLVTAILALLMPIGAIFLWQTPVVLAAMLFIGCSVGSLAPMLMATVPAETIAGERVAAAIGLVMGIGEIVGGVITPIIGGALADRWGVVAVPCLQGAYILIALVLMSMVEETAPAKRKFSLNAPPVKA
jgi:predicted MFS family arabinose efflux permease